MMTIAVKTFQNNVLGFLERVETGEKITITRRGKCVAQLVPVHQKRELARAALQELQKTAVVGDVVAPLEESWETMT